MSYVDMDLKTDVKNVKAGNPVTILFPCDWPNWHLDEKIKVKLYITNDMTGELIDNFEVYEDFWHWYDWLPNGGAKKVIQMPKFPIRIKAECYRYKDFIQGFVKEDIEDTTVDVVSEDENGEDGNGEDGNGGDEKEDKWWQKKYYGYPLWMWGVGTGSAVVLIDVLSGGKVKEKTQKPFVIYSGKEAKK